MSELAFYCLDNQNGVFVPGVILGDGDITELCAESRYYPDASNIWQPFAAGEVGAGYHAGEWWMPFHEGWTNSVTYSYDLTQSVWTATNVTVALSQTGMRGDANGASLLTASANNGTVIHDAIVAGSNPHGARWFLKRSVGSGTVEITMDNGSTWNDITTALDAASGWYEYVVSQTLVNPQIGIRLGTSGDAVIVGNAELAVDPTAGTETPTGLLRRNSAIFTNGATASVDRIRPHVPLTNFNQALQLAYAEVLTSGDDPDHGLTDTYLFNTDEGNSNAEPSNMANGNLWSSQFRSNLGAPGGQAGQVTRTVVEGEKYRITAWHDGGADEAVYAIDGDFSPTTTNFGSYDEGSELFLIAVQAGSSQSVTVWVRNMRLYTIDDLADGTLLSHQLSTGVGEWNANARNHFRLSNRIDLETQNGNPWTNIGATSAAFDEVGVDGSAAGAPNGGCTLTESDAASFSRYIRQLNVPILPAAGSGEGAVFRIFIGKDTNTARFPEISFSGRASAVSVFNANFQINTQTGAIAHRFSGGGTPSSWTVNDYNANYWEVVAQIDDALLVDDITVNIYPTYSNTLGGAGVASLTGDLIVGNVEMFIGLTAAQVSSNDPVYSPPRTVAPVELTTSETESFFMELGRRQFRQRTRRGFR